MASHPYSSQQAEAKQTFSTQPVLNMSLSAFQILPTKIKLWCCRFGKPEPHVWFDAQKVWEVKAADISISPKHQAALGLIEPGKGISIRFPRLVRVREDKTAEQTTSPEQLADMYRAQAAVNQGKQVADD